MKTRILSLILALVLLLSAVPMAAAAGAGMNNFQKINTYAAGQFRDVPTNAWFAPNVKQAYELGLIKGDSPTRFNPDGRITLAESLALAARLHSIYHGASGVFEQGDPWFQVYVDYAVEHKLFTPISGMDLMAAATRAEFAEIFANTLPSNALKPINKIKKGDIPDVSGWEDYADAVYTLYNAGILTGSDAYGTFNPNSTIIRSEVAAIVTRMADQSLRKTVTLLPPAQALPSGNTFSYILDLLLEGIKESQTAVTYMTEALDASSADARDNAVLLADVTCMIAQLYYTDVLAECRGYTELNHLAELCQQVIDTLQPVVDADPLAMPFLSYHNIIMKAFNITLEINPKITAELYRIADLYE